MPHDIFISNAVEDQSTADEVCANLESAGLRCWIALRDSVPTENQSKQASHAISESCVMVLVFSAHSNASQDITHELTQAANAKLALVPFKLDDVSPEAGKQFYLGRTHWMNAANPPSPEHIARLVERVREIVVMRDAAEARRRRLRYVWLIGAVIGLMVLAGTFAVFNAFKPPLEPTLLAVSTIRPSRTPGITPSATPTATNTPLPPTTTPTPTIIILPTATPWPTSRATPPAIVISGQAVYKESFDNPQYNGSLPPPLQPCLNALATQHDGILEVVHNADKSSCTMDLGITLKPGQFKTLDAKLSYSYGAGIGFYLINDLTKERLDFSCGRPTASTFCSVGKPDAALPDFVTPGKDSFDKWTYVRIELVDANTLEWAFYIDNTRLASYPMTVEQANHWRGSTLEFYIITYPFYPSGNVLQFDDISIIAR